MEISHHAVGNTAQASLHDSLKRRDALPLREDVGGRREVGLGDVGRLELDHHPHAALLKRLLVELGGHHRLPLGPA